MTSDSLSSSLSLYVPGDIAENPVAYPEACDMGFDQVCASLDDGQYRALLRYCLEPALHSFDRAPIDTIVSQELPTLGKEAAAIEQGASSRASEALDYFRMLVGQGNDVIELFIDHVRRYRTRYEWALGTTDTSEVPADEPVYV